MRQEDLRYEVSDEIAEISLARAPVNALSLSLLEQLIAALRRAAADENVRAVVLASALPRRFSAGLDLRLIAGKPANEVRSLLNTLYVELAEAQHDLGKPSIAAVGGAARGGGMTLAISCDVLVAGESASFGYPEIDLGLVPAIHFVHLPRIVGRHRAFELLFSGRSFGAEEAASLGLVSRIVPDERLRPEAGDGARVRAEAAHGDAARARRVPARQRRSARACRSSREFLRCCRDRRGAGGRAGVHRKTRAELVARITRSYPPRQSRHLG